MGKPEVDPLNTSATPESVADDLAKSTIDDQGEDKPDLALAKRSDFQDASAEPVIHSDQDDLLKSAVSFEELNLGEQILNGIYDIGFKTPSKIQGLSIPAILKEPRENFIGQAQSGTGKTGAFCLSMLATVDPTQNYTQCVCIAPTRELAR